MGLGGERFMWSHLKLETFLFFKTSKLTKFCALFNTYLCYEGSLSN